MAAKARRITFEGDCQRCEGSGLWQGRAGYECHGCGGTGKCTVALKRQGGGGFRLLTLSAKGNITKERYEARAELAAPLKRYSFSCTVGHGPQTTYTHTNPEGSACAAYGILDTGELMLALPGGGYGSTGEDSMGQQIEVRIIEEAAAAAIAAARELLAEDAKLAAA